MKKYLLIVIALVFYSQLSAQEIDHKNLNPPEGKTLVYILRPSLVGFAGKSEIYANDKEIGFTRGFTFIYTVLEPGTYTFNARYTKSPSTFEFEANRVYYVKQAVKSGLITIIITHELLDNEIGKTILTDLNFSKGQQYQIDRNQPTKVITTDKVIEDRDDAPPTIQVITPNINRGFDIVKTTPTLTINGKAKDESGIKEVNVNGKTARIYEDGSFTATIPLLEGNNTVTIIAIDNNMLSSTKSFQIKRNTKVEDKPVSPKDEKRVALVIGNANYSKLAALGTNPINDAHDMASTLEKLGFTVIKNIDANRSSMSDAIRDFGRQSKDADIAMFYFAGHGIQLDRVNYLLPINVDINGESDVEFECISVNRIQTIMENNNPDRLNIMVLDACRNNPFRTWSRGGSGGLADMTPPSGTIIAFATSPGSTASNGTGSNGLYTSELIKQLEVPQRIEDVFIQTRIQVEQKSSGQQSPWELARLRGVYFLKK